MGKLILTADGEETLSSASEESVICNESKIGWQQTFLAGDFSGKIKLIIHKFAAHLQ